MLTEKKILEIAEKFIKNIEKETGIETVLIKQETIRKTYGNIYFYTSKKYYETRDDKYAVAGGGPFLVEKETGKVIQFGSSQTEEYYIKRYEEGKWPIR